MGVRDDSKPHDPASVARALVLRAHASAPRIAHRRPPRGIRPRTVRAAQSSVHFDVFIWQKGKASDRLITALGARAKGVACRVLVDDMGSPHFDDDIAPRLASPPPAARRASSVPSRAKATTSRATIARSSSSTGASASRAASVSATSGSATACRTKAGATRTSAPPAPRSWTRSDRRELAGGGRRAPPGERLSHARHARAAGAGRRARDVRREHRLADGVARRAPHALAHPRTSSTSTCGRPCRRATGSEGWTSPGPNPSRRRDEAGVGHERHRDGQPDADAGPPSWTLDGIPTAATAPTDKLTVVLGGSGANEVPDIRVVLFDVCVSFIP